MPKHHPQAQYKINANDLDAVVTSILVTKPSKYSPGDPEGFRQAVIKLIDLKHKAQVVQPHE